MIPQGIHNTKLKVLYVQAFAGGGSLIALYEMLQQIDTAIIDPVVLCYYKNQYTAKLETLPGCRVIYLPANDNKLNVAKAPVTKKYGKLSGVFTAQKNILKKYFVDDKPLVEYIYRVIREEKPDIVHHNNDVRANSADIRAASKAHVVSIIHNRSLPNYGKNFTGYLLDFFLTRKARYRVNITDTVRKHHDHLFRLSPASSITLHDFTDVSKYNVSSQTNLAGKEFGIDDGDFVITNIGRIINWKGQHVLVEAIQLIKNKLENFKVLFVGSCEKGIGSENYDLHLKQLVCKYGLQQHVLFTGHREDVAAIMRVSGVIVHTSVQPEPQGLVIIEALLCNKLVIASNAGGAAEIVNKYGGLLVEPGNANELAKLLLQVYNSYKQGSLNGNAIRREKLLNDFNTKQQAKIIVDIYRETSKNHK